MIFAEIRRASNMNWAYDESEEGYTVTYRKFRSLDELMEYKDKCGAPLIIYRERDGVREIVIHDDYFD